MDSCDKKINQIKAKNILMSIKSSVILKTIFKNIKRNKFLEFIKCNKSLQKRLNLDVNDYKEYFQFYTPIEIELNLIDNRDIYFINNNIYFHIFFDDSNEEIYRYYLEENQKVKKVKIVVDYQIKSFQNLFVSCESISSITFKKFNWINITDMSYMFSGCKSLKELILSNFNTNSVIDMAWIFYECSTLEKINLSKFKIQKLLYDLYVLWM